MVATKINRIVKKYIRELKNNGIEPSKVFLFGRRGKSSRKNSECRS